MLNEQQQKAVDCTDSKILCLAGAGTGKTYSMLARIHRLIDDGVSPSSILALTFTNAAAKEMESRFHAESANAPQFCTFHAFCYRLIISDVNVRNKLGYTAGVPKIADPDIADKILAEVQLNLRTRLSAAKLFGEGYVSEKDKFDRIVVLKAFQKRLIQDNLITFDILCYKVCDLFVKDEEIIHKYKDQYKHIFVDEFQDTDIRQYRFVASFKNSSLFLVGDSLQAIYGFRGADNSIIKKLATDKDWTVIQLTINYRSTPEICETANKFSSSYADNSYRVALQSIRESGPEVVVHRYTEANCKDIKVNGRIDPESLKLFQSANSAMRLNSGYTGSMIAPGPSAILVRTNAEVRYIQDYLIECGIEYQSNLSTTSQLIQALKCLHDDKYTFEFLTSQLSQEDYANYVRKSAIYSIDNKSNYTLEQFLKDFGEVTLIKYWTHMLHDLQILANNLDLRYPENIEHVLSNMFIMFSITGRAVLKTQPHTWDEFVQQVAELVNTSQTSSLYVGTIHSAKGLEYDNVYLFGVDDKTFRLTTEENKNLLYVGITRAKNRLFIGQCVDSLAGDIL